MDWVWAGISVSAFIGFCAFMAVKGLSLRVKALNDELFRSCRIYDNNVMLIKRDFAELSARITVVEGAKKE